MSKGVKRATRGPERHRKAGLTVQVLGALLVVSSLAVALFSSGAGATSLSNNLVTVKVASSGAAAQNPLSDEENVDISVSANSQLSRSSLEAAGYPSGALPIKLLECADRQGPVANLPSKAADCEPGTIESTANLQANGSLLVKGFTVYALPDAHALGASNGTTCDESHECVIGIFADQNDFSKPHIFSAPFQVTSSPTPTTTAAGSSTQGTSTKSATVSASVAADPASSATLANTGSPTVWPWLLGAGAALLIGGTGMRLNRRRI
jgi:hypothetical protein